jgi:hypothetical protein
MQTFSEVRVLQLLVWPGNVCFWEEQPTFSADCKLVDCSLHHLFKYSKQWIQFHDGGVDGNMVQIEPWNQTIV